jgi:hypothetical protein
MKALSITACLLALPLALGALATAPASAAEISPRVAIPTPTSDITGCWSADRALYGAYHLSFCLNRGAGTYHVSGGGLNCQADVAWRKTWNGYRFVMSQSHCGKGTDWTGDTFRCTLQPVVYGVESGYGAKPRVAVPTPGPASYALACSYRPAVAGWGWETFKAYRG